MDKLRIDLPNNQIAQFCQKWQITEFALFGSVLRDDFSAESDVDVLVTFASSAHWSLFDHVEMQMELETILARPVDLISKRGIESSRNHIRRQAILDSARVVYASSC